MSVQGINVVTGALEVCRAKPENRGRGRCHHSTHVEGFDSNSIQKLAEYVNDLNMVPVSSSLRKNQKKTVNRRDNAVSNAGEISEVLANVDILTGDAVFNASSGYDNSSVNYVEIHGLDANGNQWTRDVYINGEIKNPGSGDVEHYNPAELKNARARLKDTLAALNEARIKRGKIAARRNQPNTDPAEIKEALKRDWYESIEPAVYAMNKAAVRVSAILNIPDGQLMKSMGDKADVRVGLKLDGETVVQPVSTKSDFKTGNSLVFGAYSRASEVDLIGEPPAGMSSSEVRKILKYVNSGQLPGKNKANVEALKFKYLESKGFKFKAGNAIIPSNTYRTSLETISNESGKDVTGGLVSAAYTAMDKGTFTINDLPEDAREGMLELSAARGSTVDFNPTVPYNPKSDKIQLFATVTDKSDDVATVIEKLDHEQYKKKLNDYCSFSVSNYKHSGKIGEHGDRLTSVSIHGNAVVFPVNIDCAIRRKSNSEHEKDKLRSDVHAFNRGETSVLPKQKGEFVCSECFLVKPVTQLGEMRDGKPVCRDCV